MHRRTLLRTIAGILLGAAISARSADSAKPVIGFLSGASPKQWETYVAGFRAGLAEAGFVEGKNAEIQFRWAEGHYDRLPELAAELVRREVAILVATGGPDAALAAKASTSTIPIVFTTGSDPVAFGLVASLGHPGGNTTGVTIFTVDLIAKRMELLRELMPRIEVIAFISNPNTSYANSEVRRAQEAAHSFGLQLHVVKAGTAEEIDAAFTHSAQLKVEAIIVGSDQFFNSRREQFVALAARHVVPVIFDIREFVAAGGLLSYGGNIPEAYRQAGVYTGKILNGAKPADLPVLQPTKFGLSINLKTARALGITIPQSLLRRADEVIR